MLQAQLGPKRFKLLQNLEEAFWIIFDQVHFIDRKHKIPNAHQSANAGVTAGLHQHALRGVHQNHRQIGEGSPHRHIAGVFLMAGGVRHNKAAAVRGEITVGHIDRDPLLALGHQAVQQKGIVDRPAAAAYLTVQQERLLLIGIQQLGIVKDMPDQGRFSVIHTAAGNKF